MPVKSLPSRANASARRSMIATVWPSPVRARPSDEPTRPQPTITTCTGPQCRRTDTYGDRAAHGLVGEANLDRSADRHRRRRTSAAAQARRPADLRLRRHLLDGVRDRRDRARPRRPGRDRSRRLPRARAVGGRRLRAARDRRAVVPPDDLRLPVGRRRVRRRPPQSRRDALAGRRSVAADRLHPHRCRLRRRRRAGDPVGVRLRQPVARATGPADDRPHDPGEPARSEGVGGIVRPADVPVHRHARCC